MARAVHYICNALDAAEIFFFTGGLILSFFGVNSNYLLQLPKLQKDIKTESVMSNSVCSSIFIDIPRQLHRFKK